MNKKLLTTFAIATLLFTACGSDSESSSESIESQIKKKDFIYINNRTTGCSPSNVKENYILFSNTLQVPREINPDTVIGIEFNSPVLCTRYGRTHDSLTVNTHTLSHPYA